MHIPSHHSLKAVDDSLSSPATEREPPPLVGVRKYLARLVAVIDAHRRDRRAAAELAAMEDRLLADIGLTRFDLPYARRSLCATDPWERLAGHAPR